MLLILLPILWVKFPENPILGGHELAFLRQWYKILKVSYCRNYCYDSNQILHNDKDNQVVGVDGPNMHPTNPRWWTTAIL